MKGLIYLASVMLAFSPATLMAKPGVPFQSKTGEVMRLLGFTAFGSEDSIKKLEQEVAPLAALGVKTARPKTPDGRIELMILFTDGVGPITVEVVRQKIIDGTIGTFETESITIPDSAVK